MTTVAKRVAERKQARQYSPVVEVLFVIGLLGLLISLGVAAYGIDLTPGFF